MQCHFSKHPLSFFPIRTQYLPMSVVPRALRVQSTSKPLSLITQGPSKSNGNPGMFEASKTPCPVVFPHSSTFIIPTSVTGPVMPGTTYATWLNTQVPRRGLFGRHLSPAWELKTDVPMTRIETSPKPLSEYSNRFIVISLLWDVLGAIPHVISVCIARLAAVLRHSRDITSSPCPSPLRAGW